MKPDEQGVEDAAVGAIPLSIAIRRVVFHLNLVLSSSISDQFAFCRIQLAGAKRAIEWFAEVDFDNCLIALALDLDLYLRRDKFALVHHQIRDTRLTTRCRPLRGSVRLADGSF